MATYIPQGHIPGVIPSPLEGLVPATATIAEAIIKSRERQAATADMDLISQAMAKVGNPGEPTQITSSEGNPLTQPGQPLDLTQALTQVLPQMKTTAGKAMAIKTMMENQPVPMYSAEGAPVGSVPRNAKILPRNEMELAQYKSALQLKIKEMDNQSKDNRLSQTQQFQAAQQAQRLNAQLQTVQLQIDAQNQKTAITEAGKDRRSQITKPEQDKTFDRQAKQMKVYEKYLANPDNEGLQKTLKGWGFTEAPAKSSVWYNPMTWGGSDAMLVPPAEFMQTGPGGGEGAANTQYTLPKGGKQVPVSKEVYDAYQAKYGLR